MSPQLLAGLLCLPVCAFAQRGEVHGLIQDAGGAPVAGAQVRAHNSGDNTDLAAVSAADGSYVWKRRNRGGLILRWPKET